MWIFIRFLSTVLIPDHISLVCLFGVAHPTVRSRGELSNPLRHRRGYFIRTYTSACKPENHGRAHFLYIPTFVAKSIIIGEGETIYRPYTCLLAGGGGVFVSAKPTLIKISF